MPVPPPVSALIDVSTLALLFLSPSVPAVVFLASAMGESEHAYCVNYPHYLQDFPTAKLPPKAWPEWTWDKRKRLFVPTPDDLLTDRLRQYALLAATKAQAWVEVVRALTMARYPLVQGLPMQDVVYISKKTQAQRYKDAGYPEDDLEYPYVIQYADFSGLTMRAAADEILLKSSFADDLLLKSEFFRLKYFERITKVNHPEEAERIIFDFRRDFYKLLEVDYAVYPL
jgi:hypothetical protein